MSNDDLDLFENGLGLVESMASHLRNCSECRANLKKVAKPIAVETLKIYEEESGRKATNDEKRVIARSVIIQMSLHLAAQAYREGASTEDAEAALADAASDDVESVMVFQNIVGEA